MISQDKVLPLGTSQDKQVTCYRIMCTQTHIYTQMHTNTHTPLMTLKHLSQPYVATGLTAAFSHFFVILSIFNLVTDELLTGY